MRNPPIFISIVLFFLLIFWGVFSYRFAVGQGYKEYQNLWEYRTLHPELASSERTIRAFSAGHTNTYADTLWINLIQYIGDNLFNGKYLEFTNPLVEKITQLHPHFTEPYNLSLILTPILRDADPLSDQKRNILQNAITIAERWIRENCNTEKIGEIEKRGYGDYLWSDIHFSNICHDDMLAYNLAYIYDELWEKTQAQKYYMVASTQTDWPQAARFLAVLTDAKWWEHLKASEKFLLTAISGYDESPFSCQVWAITMKQKLQTPLDTLVKETEKWESTLTPPQDTKNPLSSASTTCYQASLRAAKQIYLAWITERAKQFPEAKTGTELIKLWAFESYPTPLGQKWWNIAKKNGLWRYQLPD